METDSRPALRLSEVAPLGFSVLALGLLIAPIRGAADLVAVLASVLAFAVFVPQAAHVWRQRNDAHALSGVSVTTNMFVVNNSIIWLLYAAQLGEFWVGAAGIVNMPLAAMIVAIIVRSRLRTGARTRLRQPGYRATPR